MYIYRATCAKVVDGDTFDFDIDLGFKITHRIRVRLQDVDTPEMNSKLASEREHAKEATAFVRTHLLNDVGPDSPWVIIKTKKDRIGIYGRYTASVMLSDSTDLGTLIMEAGFEKKAAYKE